MNFFNSKKKAVFSNVKWKAFAAKDIFFKETECTLQFKNELQLLKYRLATIALKERSRNTILVRFGVDPSTFSVVFCTLENEKWTKDIVYYYSQNNVIFKEFHGCSLDEVQERLDIVRAIAEFAHKQISKKC